ncbi:MAG: hypothetical protein HXX18_06245 [Bacteroidetes bacterium]|nr:hypothetical protein [Bacteroidota bacterium]
MTNSKLTGFTILLVIVIASCISGKQKVIEGDLYFNRIDLYRIFDSPDSTLTKIEHEMLQVNSDTCNQKDKDFIDLVKYAIKNKLTRQPYVWILIKGKEYRLFLDQQDYDKLKNYELSELTDEHKKIYIKAIACNVSYKELKAVKCTKLLDFKKIDGETKYE